MAIYLNEEWLMGFLDSILDKEKRTLDRATKLLERGRNYYNNNLFNEAFSSFSRVYEELEESKAMISKYPKEFSVIYDELGFAFYQVGRGYEANSCLDIALQLDPVNVNAISHKGLVLFQSGRTEDALKLLFGEYVDLSVYRALLESAASEHGARMTAMRSAAENAGVMIDRLTLEMNRVRQAEITQEILEVVGGAEALGSS